MIQLTVAGDAEAAARTTAERVAAVIADARAERGVVHISVAGGRTPAATYRLLADLVHDWSGVHLWFGDERCVPLDDADSNCKLIVDTLLSGATQPPPTVHPVTGAADDPATAAAAYEQELRDELGGDLPRLDLALLGLGEDGHTASLFPDDPVLGERERLVLPVHGTKPPFDRITLTLPALRAARRTIVLAEGAGKAWAIGQLLAGPSPRIPASLIDYDGAEIELIVDHTAAPS
ncbi:6-phosphogluconolactonase [Conexibacter sp. JD483]|uniref:6-phosphogluconolactonase n=1 Tax=unclassified Conexibacter TaxID=2627773 RepID=UPI00272299C2|nr:MULTISPECIES: 6-phosphogluconolactonase [unclassified Conexibacter]MDO8188307.1 6-phosphogluconolactonase [Conexibacter sp. CPCC 205706]MDO8198987.1 6-phosphogluconolactonase [Conexibacter sp. CPCC 205762]MDR9372800.1 6-phosphogluconolactonase [Conexibacter sp. JD483]